MKTLPNGLRIFNGTPHVIRFWTEGWDTPVEVPPDEAITAKVEDLPLDDLDPRVEFVEPVFTPTLDGMEIVNCAIMSGADVIVGSIIAAQAYPCLVAAMTPTPGFERVPPAEKRMNPSKFTMYTG